MWVEVEGQCHWVKKYGMVQKGLSQAIYRWNMKVISLTILKIWPSLKFLKNGSRSKSLGQTFLYEIKGLVTRNKHVKRESPIS